MPIEVTSDLSRLYADRVNDILKAQNISHKKFGEMIEKGMNWVSNFFKGRNHLTTETLDKIAQALGITRIENDILLFEVSERAEKLIFSLKTRLKEKK